MQKTSYWSARAVSNMDAARVYLLHTNLNKWIIDVRGTHHRRFTQTWPNYGVASWKKTKITVKIQTYKHTLPYAENKLQTWPNLLYPHMAYVWPTLLPFHGSRLWSHWDCWSSECILVVMSDVFDGRIWYFSTHYQSNHAAWSDTCHTYVSVIHWTGVKILSRSCTFLSLSSHKDALLTPHPGTPWFNHPF